ncbi:MAG: hypothetical protein WD066_14015 [Planctomycetaceae bacterium]
MKLAHSAIRLLPSVLMLGVAIGGSAALLSGCGGSDSSPDQTGAVGAKEAGGAASPTADNRGATGTEPVVHVDGDGRKWVGKVPLDVFFDDPLRIVEDSRPVATASASSPSSVPTVSPAPSIAPVGATATTAQPAATAGNWADAIGHDVLDDEVKKIVNRLNEKLQTVGTYNSSHLELPPHINTLAVLAEVAVEHPGEVRWKDKAKYIRDLAGRMAAEKLQQGAKSHKALQEPFEQITVLMSGSDPGGLPDSPERRPFSEVSEFFYIMKRIESGSTWLKVNVTSDEALSSSKEDVLREAGVLSVLGKVIVSEGSDYADFEDFVGYSKDLVEAGRQMTAAAHAGNFAEYDKGITRAYKACQECHSVYK